MSGCGDEAGDDCRAVLDRIYEYLDQEMADLDCDRIRQHLQECGPCLREYHLDEVLKELVRRSCPCEPAPLELRDRILTRIIAVRVEFDG